MSDSPSQGIIKVILPFLSRLEWYNAEGGMRARLTRIICCVELLARDFICAMHAIRGGLNDSRVPSAGKVHERVWERV